MQVQVRSKGQDNLSSDKTLQGDQSLIALKNSLAQPMEKNTKNTILIFGMGFSGQMLARLLLKAGWVVGARHGQATLMSKVSKAFRFPQASRLKMPPLLLTVLPMFYPPSRGRR